MKLSLRGLLTAFPAAILLVLGTHGAAKAANFFFEPEGAQLDSDPIFDILTEPGSEITFNVKFDTTGIVFNPNTVSLTFDYTFQHDGFELTPKFDFASLPKTVPLASGQVNTLPFDVNMPGRSPHDGISDFGITLINVVERDNLGAVLNIIAAADFDAPDKTIRNLPGDEYNQVVEVQKTPEPTSTIGLLALSTLGAASTFKRKLKQPKSIEKDTTKGG